jgi:hypothetical protein
MFVARTWTGKSPVALGVQVTNPVVEPIVIPGGPETSDQEIGVVPVAVT